MKSYAMVLQGKQEEYDEGQQELVAELEVVARYHNMLAAQQALTRNKKVKRLERAGEKFYVLAVLFNKDEYCVYNLYEREDDEGFAEGVYHVWVEVKAEGLRKAVLRKLIMVFPNIPHRPAQAFGR